MLVSHRYKFIYIKTHKTDGTSVESYFEPFCMLSGEWKLSEARDEYVSEAGIIGFRGHFLSRPKSCIWFNHMPACLIRARVGEEVWSTYFKFCVIRNPYEKAVSSYYFHKNNPSEVSDWEKERADFELWLQIHRVPIDYDKYMIGGEFCLDDVIRYEKLETDLQRICVRLGIPWNPANLPSFKVGLRPKNAKVETLYTEKSKRIVETAYAFEFNLFNYSFLNSDVQTSSGNSKELYQITSPMGLRSALQSQSKLQFDSAKILAYLEKTEVKKTIPTTPSFASLKSRSKARAKVSKTTPASPI